MDFTPIIERDLVLDQLATDDSRDIFAARSVQSDDFEIESEFRYLSKGVTKFEENEKARKLTISTPQNSLENPYSKKTIRESLPELSFSRKSASRFSEVQRERPDNSELLETSHTKDVGYGSIVRWDESHLRDLPKDKPLSSIHNKGIQNAKRDLSDDTNLNLYFINGRGIHREVLLQETCRMLGPEATIKPDVCIPTLSSLEFH